MVTYCCSYLVIWVNAKSEKCIFILDIFTQQILHILSGCCGGVMIWV